jgi:hypothetical protein
MVFVVVAMDEKLTCLIRFRGFLTFLDFRWRVRKMSWKGGVVVVGWGGELCHTLVNRKYIRRAVMSSNINVGVVST